MNIYITLDYELFFGNTGNPEDCIINPTNRLISLAEKYNFKCVFFVDVGYLIALKRNYNEYPELKKHYDLVSSQIKEMADLGHQIQLHIHPHWEDSCYNGKSWVLDLSRYRLNSFSEEKINDIFQNYSKELSAISGKPVFVYRAGGWCIQPFNKLKAAFKNNGIRIDSTIYYKGKNSTAAQWYDFNDAPDKSYWRFDTDPCIENKAGQFIEIPIASTRINPFFYWKFVASKIFGGKKHASFGNGSPSKASKFQLLKLLLFPSHSVVSMDGFKSSLLLRAYKRNSQKNFVVIGHPKAFSEFSLKQFENFIGKALSDGNAVVIYADDKE